MSTSRLMDSTFGGPGGEEVVGKVSLYLYPLCGYGGAMPISLRELGEPVVVDMRAIKMLPVVVDAVD